jgi:hypothetical protein
MANGNDKWSSRKYRTAWYLTALSTITLTGPYVASLFLNIGTCESLITGSQWLTFLFGIWGIYFGANIAEKHGMFTNGNDKKAVTKTEKINTDPLADDNEGEYEW